jgi:hypothetical protein
MPCAGSTVVMEPQMHDPREGSRTCALVVVRQYHQSPRMRGHLAVGCSTICSGRDPTRSTCRPRSFAPQSRETSPHGAARAGCAWWPPTATARCGRRTRWASCWPTWRRPGWPSTTRLTPWPRRATQRRSMWGHAARGHHIAHRAARVPGTERGVCLYHEGAVHRVGAAPVRGRPVRGVPGSRRTSGRAGPRRWRRPHPATGASESAPS